MPTNEEMDKYLEDQDVRLISQQPPDMLDFAQFIHVDGRVKVGQITTEYLDAFNRSGGTFLVKVNATTFRVYTSPHFSKPFLSEDRMNLQWVVDIAENKLERRAGYPAFLGTLVVQVDAFKQQHRLWKDYWTWKKNRNPARAELEKEHGLDVKHAMHLVRLLRMAREILEQGKVIIKRPDAEELLAIRNGRFNYDELVREAELADKELDVLYQRSKLPDKPDRVAINKLLVDVTTEYWKRNGLF